MLGPGRGSMAAQPLPPATFGGDPEQIFGVLRSMCRSVDLLDIEGLSEYRIVLGPPLTVN